MALLTAPAQATPVVGIAVADTSSTTQIGNYDSTTGEIGFFANLSGSSTYGVDGGTSADTCNVPNDCGNGQLTMNLFFEGVQPGMTTVSFLFEDLDSSGVNDPWFFIEELQIYDGNGVLIETINTVADLTAGNNFNQLIELDLNVAGDFYMTLVFTTVFDQATNYGNYTNSEEFLLATATSIPEPGTLALLGAGLLLLAISQRRRRRAVERRRSR